MRREELAKANESGRQQCAWPDWQRRRGKGEEETSLPIDMDGVKKEQDVTHVVSGGLLRRIKNGKVGDLSKVNVEREDSLRYYTKFPAFLRFLLREKQKTVPLSDLIEVRTGYSTDNFHRGAAKYEFQCNAPEDHCFSVVYNHKKFLHKSVDFAAPDPETRDKWVKALQYLVSREREKRAHFNETQWFQDQFKAADTNHNGKVSFDEVWRLLNRLNLQLSHDYAKAVFASTHENDMLDEARFVSFFEKLTERPELRHVLRLFSEDGVESLNVRELNNFLTQEQQFTDVDLKKTEGIMDTFEQTKSDRLKERVMGPMGLRRLLLSKWGCILKLGHEGVFQDMDQPLPHYFVSSSHNTYLTGLQMKGEATVEGYVAALTRGARLVELDLFDGEHGSPVITHKRTLINPITLKDALQAIIRVAFTSSPFPIILTLENHVSLPQQKVMAELFQEILGDALYRPAKDSSRREMLSPKALKGKVILRGKKLDGDLDDFEQEEDERGKSETAHNLPIHPMLSALIGLPSVKMTSNIYADIKQHPCDGSPSLSESKVDALFEAGAPIAAYSAERFVKSYPKGLRQDSSNMHPMNSWLTGVQAVAMNFQTAGEELDLNHGLFRINGSCGYVLKPACLLKGIDLRSLRLPRIELHVGIISAQYLPKSEPGKDIIDPYVSVEVFGTPRDTWKVKTRVIKDNGFNPVWNESFSTRLCCPEMALIRFCVKDFDSTSANDFVGEYTIPFTSIRPGYSQIRLNTGYHHTLDQSASLFVRIALDPIISPNGDVVELQH